MSGVVSRERPQGLGFSTGREAQFDECWRYWFDIWGVKEAARYHVPGKPSLQRYIDKLGVGEVKHAMDIAEDKFSNLSSYPVRYMFGVLKRKAGRLDGTVQTCPGCGKDVVLEDDEDPSKTWWHAKCLDKHEAGRG